MIHKVHVPGDNSVRVTFELPSCIWADRIHVTGEFNEWSQTATPMRQGRDGVWRASIELPLGGRYRFRYLIDGQWQTDWHADGSVTNSYGSEDSLIDTAIDTAIVHHARRIDTTPGALVREGQGALPSPAQRPAALPQPQTMQSAA